MGRNLDDIIESLPEERQRKIKALSAQMVEEMIAHAQTLTDFRKAVGKTQAQVAKELGIKQNAVSQLEKRSDTYVSTLRRFLKTLDLSLELSVVAKNGARINLPNFLPWREAEAAAAESAVPAAATKTPARKAVAARVSPKKAVVTKKPRRSPAARKT
ncbi:MAG TPA: helix-turn-helix domain-containing protein [Burkholderiaceae bacterium]|jgi:transcriptional regulator with XRE-family HTH domain